MSIAEFRTNREPDEGLHHLAEDRSPARLSDILGEHLNVPQVSRLPQTVEKFAAHVEHRFAATADMMLRTAEQLEERAAKLRKNADWLLGQRGLANDIREAVSFEQNSFDEVKSLALVNVGMRQDS